MGMSRREFIGNLTKVTGGLVVKLSLVAPIVAQISCHIFEEEESKSKKESKNLSIPTPEVNEKPYYEPEHFSGKKLTDEHGFVEFIPDGNTFYTISIRGEGSGLSGIESVFYRNELNPTGKFFFCNRS